MPKRHDLKSILIIGAGPIVIGQACEFDYSGAQACKALREEGYRVILVNSNPATIMTDPEMADATYIEPITWQVVEKIIAKEKPDALLPTMGGQTALNCALDLHRHGVLAKHGVEMIGANEHAIEKAEDRLKFKDAMTDIGLDSARSGIAHSMDEALAVQRRITAEIGGTGFPMVIRPSFTLGGTGGGIAYNPDEFEEICKRGLDLSPTKELLIEEIADRLERVRDGGRARQPDNCIIVCSDREPRPDGHPHRRLDHRRAGADADRQGIPADAQRLDRHPARDRRRHRRLQRAVLDQPGERPHGRDRDEPARLPRSALASKATGFPIAKVAAKLAVGYTLDELRNDITGGATPASFEPSIDYVVTKIPRFAFEKFPAADPHLTTQMKSVGEVMAMGRTFQESFQKALRGLETGIDGLSERRHRRPRRDHRGDRRGRPRAHPVRGRRLPHRHDAGRDLRGDGDRPLVPGADRADRRRPRRPWPGVRSEPVGGRMRFLKQKGFSDRRLARLLGTNQHEVRAAPPRLGVRPVYKRVDTCAAEFATQTAYMYSTYDEECEAEPTDRKKIMVLGGGPNRIGQGIEFDYCCVHAALAMREDGYETIMVNCNPETVSTDYDTCDRLYFEPVTLEDVLEIVDKEKPLGVIVQYGGQTPLKLALDLERAGVPIIGTSPDSIDIAEDRERFQQLLHEARPAASRPTAPRAPKRRRSSWRRRSATRWWCARATCSAAARWRSCTATRTCERYMREAVQGREKSPVLLDRFLDDADRGRRRLHQRRHRRR